MNSKKAMAIISTFLILSLIGFGSVKYAAGETISGYVHDIHGVGIDKVWMVAFSIGGSGCGSWHNGISTDANGNYSLEVTAGTYYISADASFLGCQPYVDEYYSVGGGTNLCEEATPVTAGDSGVNFVLADGKIISGKVSASTDGKPIEQVQMVLYTGQACDGTWYGGRPTDENGEYCVTVPSNTYYIYTEASHHISQDYIDEWWTSGSGTRKCAEAEGVIVSNSDVPNIDFLLDARRGINWMLLLFDN